MYKQIKNIYIYIHTYLFYLRSQTKLINITVYTLYTYIHIHIYTTYTPHTARGLGGPRVPLRLAGRRRAAPAIAAPG